jgi:hypothetical protein
MMHSDELLEKLIRITMFAHKKVGLLMATSDDLPGFNLLGQSEEEIERKLPAAVRDFLEMSGYKIVRFDLMRDKRLEAFLPAAFVAHASLSATHDQC